MTKKICSLAVIFLVATVVCCLLAVAFGNEQKMKFRSGTAATLSSANRQKGFGLFPFKIGSKEASNQNSAPTKSVRKHTFKHSTIKNAKGNPAITKKQGIEQFLKSTQKNFRTYADKMISAEDNYERISVTVDALIENKVALALTTIGVFGAISKILPPNPQK